MPSIGGLYKDDDAKLQLFKGKNFSLPTKNGKHLNHRWGKSVSSRKPGEAPLTHSNTATALFQLPRYSGVGGSLTPILTHSTEHSPLSLTCHRHCLRLRLIFLVGSADPESVFAGWFHRSLLDLQVWILDYQLDVTCIRPITSVHWIFSLAICYPRWASDKNSFLAPQSHGQSLNHTFLIL